VPKQGAPDTVCAFETCAACGGNGLPGGRPIPTQVYASPGVGIKA
jgi:hypothetical protein